MWNSEKTWMRNLGSTGLTVSALGLGGSPLGSNPEVFGNEVGFDQAIDLMEATIDSPIRFVDTSNGYSDGESERRIGHAIQAAEHPRDFLVTTKVDPRGTDFSGRRVRESVAESKARLGIDFFPLIYLHDPEFHDVDALLAPGGAVETLVQLKQEGHIGAIGVAGGDTEVLSRILDSDVFEVLLVHSRWTLVDRSAGEVIAKARQREMGVVNAAIYGGGLLAKPGGVSARYGYKKVSEETLNAVMAMDRICKRYGTNLATAALHFSLRTPEVDATVVGMSSRQRLNDVLQACQAAPEDELWNELEALLPPATSWLG